MLMRRSSSRRRQRGIASVEFALVAPFLLSLTLAVFELTHRLQMADETKRYTFQLGDILSRSDTLTDTEILDVYNVGDQMVRSARLTPQNHAIRVVSVGYDPDGEARILWERTAGDDPPTFDLTRAEGLGDPGQSVLHVTTQIKARTWFSVVGNREMTLTSRSVFKPRTTRAIAINGALTDPHIEVAGYSGSEE